MPVLHLAAALLPAGNSEYLTNHPQFIAQVTDKCGEAGREIVRYTGRYDNISFNIKTTCCQSPTCVSDLSLINHITMAEGSPQQWDRQLPRGTHQNDSPESILPVVSEGGVEVHQTDREIDLPKHQSHPRRHPVRQ